MVLCDSFTNNVECSLELTNLYNLKLIILCLLVIYSLISLYYSKFLAKEEVSNNFWSNYIFKILPSIYLIFVIPLFLTLKHSISLEIFLLILTGLGFVVFLLFFGASLSYANNFIWKLFGMSEEKVYNDSKKYKETKRKHGES